MAMNPMQRKSRNSFLLGMLITMILAGGVIGFLIYQMSQTNEKLRYAESATAYVFAREVKSGEIVTSDMLKMVKINPRMVPADAGNVMNMLANEYLIDQNGNKISGDVSNGLYYYNEENGEQIDIFRGKDGKYYYKSGTTNVEVQISGTYHIAKIDILPNTPVTSNMLTTSENAVNKDVRLEEYNMLKLPATLQKGEYIDVRMTLPTGQDYIVISKKEVKKCDLTTIWIEVSEDEITTMNNAIIESYIMDGAQLYAIRYVEPGLQLAAIPTYPVSPAVYKAQSTNPNILQEAREAYNNRVAANDPTSDRQAFEAALSQYAADRKENVEKGVEESATKALESRAEYIDSLNLE